MTCIITNRLFLLKTNILEKIQKKDKIFFPQLTEILNFT